ncbi:hypothetical protein FACS1894109_15690 [Spirochaetia bacterium]|nr:hypothetical protein FACS1894109_15690 [Spirochaetia bacterium]
MAGKKGTPHGVITLKLHIPEDWVLKKGKVRYVFVDALSPKIWELSKQVDGTQKLAYRFSTILHRGLYSITELFGLRAINIDEPQNSERNVSVQFEIIVGEGKDEVWKIT